LLNLLFRIVIVLSISTSLCCAAPRTERGYFVSPDGSDNNDGRSVETPWKSLEKVNASKFKPGDTIRFEGGRIFESNILLYQSALLISDSGTPDSPIVYTSYGGLRALIKADTIGVMCSGKEYVEFRSINVSGSFKPFDQRDAKAFKNIGLWFINHNSNRKLRGIKIDSCSFTSLQTNAINITAYNENSPQVGGYDGVEITNCRVDSIGHIGIIMNWSAMYLHSFSDYPLTNITIRNCEISRVTGLYNNFVPGTMKHDTYSGNGIFISHTDSALIERNTVYSCGGSGFDTIIGSGPSGIEAAASRRITCQYNEVYDIKASTGSDGHGMHFGDGVQNSIMQYNYSHNNDGPGFSFHCYGNSYPLANSNNVLRYSISARNGRESVYNACEILVSSFNPKTTDNISVYNNTIYSVRQNSIEMSVIEVERSATNISFRNNIIISDDPDVLIINVHPLQNPTSVVLQGNLYWSKNGSYKFREGNDTFYTYQSWQGGASRYVMREVLNGKNSGIIDDPKVLLPENILNLNNSYELSRMNEFRMDAASVAARRGLNLKELFGLDPGKNDFFGNSILEVDKFSIGAHQLPTP
jgi:hypothetical protein